MADRNIRVGEEIKEVLSDLIRTQIRRPVTLFSISHVNVTRDLAEAKVYLSFFGKDPHGDFESIQQAKGFLRSQMSKIIKLRHAPKLEFEMDHSLQEGARLVEKINSLGVTSEDKPEV